jgi:4-amino-4-deoxy-L-arabinose transferase-like glycosyltransferase
LPSASLKRRFAALKGKIHPALYAALLAAVALGAGALLLLQIGQPLVADEPQFVDVASSLAGTARPMGYSGSAWNPVLSHPLLYHSLVAVPVGLAGKAAWAGRLVGVVAFYAAGVMLWFAAREVTGERWGPFLAVVLYGVHPLAVQSALLVEIDTGLLPLVTMAFVWYLVRRGFDLGRGGWVGLGLLFGVALMAKLTTPPLLVAALVIYCLVTGRPGRAAYVLPALALGAALFAAYFIPYCAIKNLPILEPFEHSFSRAAAPGGAFAGLILKRALKLVLWLGLPFLLAFAIVFIRKSSRRLEGVDAGAAYAALAASVILVFYLFIGGDGYGFVKYHAPLVPLAALALGAAFGPALAKESKLTLVFLGGLAFVYYLLAARDPLYWPYVAREAKEVLLAPYGEINKALALTGAFVVLPVIAFIVMTRRGGRAMSFVILAVAAGPALDIWHARADYEHRYNYGERGLAAAAAALETIPRNLNLVVPIDVAFAEGYRHPHVAVEDVLTDAEEFRAWVRDRHTGAVVLRDSYYIHDPYRGALEYQKAITVLENMYNVERRGSFTVALRKEELRAAARY